MATVRRGAEGRDDKEDGDDEDGDDEGGDAEEGGNGETRQVEGRTTEQSHMALLLVFLFFV